MVKFSMCALTQVLSRWKHPFATSRGSGRIWRSSDGRNDHFQHDLPFSEQTQNPCEQGIEILSTCVRVGPDPTQHPKNPPATQRVGVGGVKCIRSKLKYNI